MKDKVTKLIASCFYLGYIPVMPGTLASLFGLGVYFLIGGTSAVYFFTVFTVIILGFLVCTNAEKVFGRKDAGKIVIDEVAGMLIAFMFVPPDIFIICVCFIFFRLFDIIKPYPLRKFEQLNGGLGVMLDDIGAGIYANICVQIFLRLAINSAS